MKNTICLITIVLALIFVVGSAGALERGNITCLQCLVQSAVALLAMWIAGRNLD